MIATLDAFVREDRDGLYVHPNRSIINYTDGAAVEQEIYRVLRSATDRGTQSDELPRFIHNWETEYHLSPRRANLLRHIQFKPTDRVLEIGSGCGAMTRYVGESGAAVTAIEGSEIRARCTAARCGDLPNVRVFCGSFEEIALEAEYDFVLLIGVLEYSSLYIQAAAPELRCLELARRALNRHGIIIVAIENKLGLKYFMGMREDHTGKPYFGLQGLYHRKTARTFGRLELGQLAVSAGFKNVVFHYPFPDYKLPQAVFCENAFVCPAFQPAQIIRQYRARDYGIKRSPRFSEALVWPQLAANGLIPSFSNSFLMLASREPIEQDPEFLASIYNVNRLSPYRTATRFSRQPDGSILVSKRPMTAGDGNSSSVLRMRTGDCPYHSGPTLAMLMLEAKLRGDEAGFVDLGRRWFTFLSAREQPSSEGSVPSPNSLPDEYFDCLPHNLIQTQTGIEYIDREWSIARSLRVAVILLRGFYYLLATNPEIRRCFGEQRLRDIIERWIFVVSGCAVERQSWEEFIRVESDVSMAISGVDNEAELRAEIFYWPRVRSALAHRWKRVLRKAGFAAGNGGPRQASLRPGRKSHVEFFAQSSGSSHG